ncbi:MAG: TIGR03067 domain-containing protein [Planctomycetaceae bacterium]
MLRILASASVLVWLVLPGFAEEPDVVRDEREALRGYWAPQRYEQGLTLTEDTGFGHFTAEIDDEVWVNRYGLGRLWAWRYSIDPTAEPKRIDFEGRREVGPDATIERYVRLGIYKIEGDVLTLCFSAVEPVEPEHRPSDFSARPGSGRIMTVFKRSTPPADEARAANAAAWERQSLQGPGLKARPTPAAPIEQHPRATASAPAPVVAGPVIPAPRDSCLVTPYPPIEARRSLPTVGPFE